MCVSHAVPGTHALAAPSQGAVRGRLDWKLRKPTAARLCVVLWVRLRIGLAGSPLTVVERGLGCSRRPELQLGGTHWAGASGLLSSRCLSAGKLLAVGCWLSGTLVGSCAPNLQAYRMCLSAGLNLGPGRPAESRAPSRVQGVDRICWSWRGCMSAG